MTNINAANTQMVALASKAAYHKRIAVQLHQWMLGNPIHNPVDNECVPDFSCCRGRAHLAPARERELFCRDPASRPSMLHDWQGAFLESSPAQAISGWDLPGVVVMSLERKAS